ncbi:MAG: Gfo/Idh/MocA family oxidoreductase [Anaerolineaceae bacterium]|nr:Gfo/Idh/MocA family oxidoreductase [Anaerolineaceae bacterium]
MKLGYVGLDSSHADQLTRMVNVEPPAELPEAKFTHLWGRDPERAKVVQEKGRIENIVEAPEEMIGLIDGVVVGSRAGDRHLAEARPFIEAGLPVFVDKPLANSLTDAAALVALADKHGARLTSFSGLRVVPEVVEFKKQLQAIDAEKYGGAINGHGDNTNEYGGWYFYAVHSIELLLEVFGLTGGELLAAEIGSQLHVRSALDDGQIVTIQLSAKYPPFSLIGFVDHNSIATIVPLGGMQEQVARRVVGFFHGAEDLAGRELLAPLVVMEAVRESLSSGKTARYEV